ncbi:hypothetical protein KX928_12755 [Roseobacter sp. YSTF-M11]|uniref:Uncharacterized protein n=1 Tax=Roseobacter insulae TaxID=2859783 RepID=A0A9X1FX53_9RHOB|nr:hypothetical protein [Roseobacter insulae]MBW4708655.1 hypothetical protein [Roseobacter insulae]
MTVQQMTRLAASGVAKVDLMGPRGTTLCTMDEIEAMALVIAASGVLPGRPGDPERLPLFLQLEKDKT